MLRILLSLMIYLMCNGVFTQDNSYPFWMNEQMPCIEHYLKDSCVSLIPLRKTTNLLTNRDLNVINGIPLTKRRKAFIRHVKHLSEQLEEFAIDRKKVNDSILNLISELEHLKF